MKKTARYLFLLVALIMALSVVLVACKKEVTITLSRTTLSVKAGGRPVALTAKVENSDEAVVWTTSNASVATVNGGVVTGVAVGTATVTATVGEVSATCAVTVHNNPYEDDYKNYTTHDYMQTWPSNWNEIDYQMNDDTAIMNYIQSSFFTYEYALKDESAGRVTADGKLNVDNLDFDNVILTYDAATALADVTAQYGDAWGLTAAQKSDGGYIWRITIREDLKWDDGSAIKAQDFVYSMQEQLNTLLSPFRANTYWSENGMKIHNAKNYYFQGRVVNLPVSFAKVADLKAQDDDGVYLSNGLKVFVDCNAEIPFLNGSYTHNALFFDGYESFEDFAEEEGLTALEPDEEKGITQEMIDEYVAAVEYYWTLLFDQDEDGHVYATEEVFDALGFLWVEFFEMPESYVESYLHYFTFATESFADIELTFKQVGIFAEDDYNIVVVLDQAESWLKSDGSLSWHVSNCSLPLVKQDMYEACKTAPSATSDKWTTTYCTTQATTPSWGPYKLTFFQEDKQFVLDRNEYWYGYEGAYDQYLTDRIVVDKIATPEAARMAFWKGEIDSLDFADMGDLSAQYQNSAYAVFTPSTSGTAYGIQLYSNLPVLKESGKNNGILAIRDFRWALNLAFDRQAFIEDQLIGMQVGLGYLGPSYYYDPENALSYRGTDQAKATLLRTYGFTQNDDGKWTDGQKTYADIDDAVDAMTGYNLTVAKQKLALAITELTGNAEKYGYDATKDIILRLGQFNAKAPRRAELLQSCINTLTEGSELAGKIKIEIVNAYDNSADDFRDGKFELYCVAGIGGAVFYPFSSMNSYLGWGDLSYHNYADYSASLTMTMPAGDYAGAGQTLTLTLKDWHNSLNNITGEGDRSYNWSEGFCPTEVRLEILAMLEEYALSQFRSIQVADDYNVYMKSARTSNITDEYNVFMGFGGSRYVRFDYTDEEWEAFVAEHNGDLSTFYKTSAN